MIRIAGRQQLAREGEKHRPAEDEPPRPPRGAQKPGEKEREGGEGEEGGHPPLSEAVPVEPKPPAPRWLVERLSTARQAMRVTGASRIWAMRLP